MSESLPQIFETVAGWYREPMFLYFPVFANLIALSAFCIMAAPLTYLAIRNPEWARKYRIQERRLKSYDGIVNDSVKQLLLNFLLMLILSVLSWPVLRLTGIHTGPLPPWYVIAGQVLLFTILDDFLYYWAHRFMHVNPWLYRNVHKVHHRVTTPIAITGNYLHPVEFVMISSMVLIGPVLLSAHIVTVWIWVVVRQWEAAEQHSGYSFPWNPLHWLPFYDGPAFHDFHHTKFIGNYAGLYNWTDTVFGTRSAKYDEYITTGAKDTTDIVPEPEPGDGA